MSARAMLVALLALAGCAPIEWRTDKPITPSTYEAPAYRSVTSVGRLSRLAVMPAVVHLEAEEAERAQPGGAEQHRDREKVIGTVLEEMAVEYLAKMKGYETLHITEPGGRWRGANEDAAAIREAGLQFKVDGVVVIERWVTRPWTFAQAMLNFATANIMLVAAMRAPSLRVSIYETASGRLVWTTLLRGPSWGEHPDRNTVSGKVSGALREIENAVPPQLRR